MSIATKAPNHWAELIELKEATAHMLIETSYAASIHHAYVWAANTHAELSTFINESAITADKSNTGTTPCK